MQPEPAETAALQALTKGLKGKIVWSTSRDGNHDIYIANVDGSDAKPLTKGPKTDWFSHFSPDGKHVLFTRSKLDWAEAATGGGVEGAADFANAGATGPVPKDGDGAALPARSLGVPRDDVVHHVVHH